MTVYFEIKRERRDMWVGYFYEDKPEGRHHYVCPVPTVVIHWLTRTKVGQ